MPTTMYNFYAKVKISQIGVKFSCSAESYLKQNNKRVPVT